MQNNDHTCLFQCINTCQIPREMFEHSAFRPRVQTPSTGPEICKCMQKHDLCDLYNLTLEPGPSFCLLYYQHSL